VSVNFFVNATSRLVTYVVEGSASNEDMCEFFDAVAESPQFEKGFAFLGDCRKFYGDPQVSLVRSVASEIRTRAGIFGPCKWAMLFSTAAGFGAVRVCGLLTYGTGIQFEPFMTPVEAERWLGTESFGKRDVLIH
jgi:hypothetical protein